MHILAALGAVIAAIVIILYRMQQASDAARNLADAAGDAHGLFRRWKWRRKHLQNPLDAIEDAREAAAAMMVVVAQSDGLMSQAESQAILGQMTHYFGATSKQAEELLARARWLVQDRSDAGEAFRRLKPVIVAQCGPQERRDLIDMLNAVAQAGAASDLVVLDIKRLAQALQE